jgi:hypothetical protein
MDRDTGSNAWRAPRWQGWTPVWGWLIERTIDGVGLVLSTIIVVLRDRRLGPLSVGIAASGLIFLLGRRLVRSGQSRHGRGKRHERGQQPRDPGTAPR